MTKDKVQDITPKSPSPSPWVRRFLPSEGKSKRALDLACGGGRHTQLLLSRDYQVTALDRDLSKLGTLRNASGLTAVEADLETGADFPLAGQIFDVVVVANYLHRPLFPALIGAVAPGGLFLYETFALGNERFGRPSNPDFLLQPGELLRAVDGKLQVLAYENLDVTEPKPAAIQRIAAQNTD